MSGAHHCVALCMIHVVAGMGHLGPTVFMVTLQPWCGGEGGGGESIELCYHWGRDSVTQQCRRMAFSRKEVKF